MTYTGSNSMAALMAPVLGVDSPIIIGVKTTAEPGPSGADCGRLTGGMARGEEAAFQAFYQQYCHRLLRYLLVVANGREEIAAEALQLTFVRVARHVRRFDSEAAFWSWLTVLARSSFVDEQRKRGRYQNLLERFFREQPAAADWPGGEADEHLSQLLHEEISGLPDEERGLLERKYFQGEAVRSLAGQWQITEKAMEARLLRIRRKLKTAVLDRLKNEAAH